MLKLPKHRSHGDAAVNTVPRGRLLIVVFSICSILTACSNRPSSRVQDRLNYWRSSLAHDIPPGTRISAAREWFRARHIKVDFLEKQRWLYANVESVPNLSRIPFPCSDWNIIIKIPIDAADDTVENDVSTVGTCL